jgi:hypothetical protein
MNRLVLRALVRVMIKVKKVQIGSNDVNHPPRMPGYLSVGPSDSVNTTKAHLH